MNYSDKQIVALKIFLALYLDSDYPNNAESQQLPIFDDFYIQDFQAYLIHEMDLGDLLDSLELLEFNTFLNGLIDTHNFIMLGKKFKTKEEE